MNEPLTFHILGCRGSWPVSGREYREFGGQTTCQILKQGDRAAVIDLGTGFYEGLKLLRDCSRIDIILTHLHYDHIMGLFDWFERPKDAEIHFYGNFSAWPPVSDFLRPPYWPYTPELPHMNPIESFETPMPLSTGGTVTFFRADHPDHACIPLIEWDGRKILILQDNGMRRLFSEALAEDCDLLVTDGMLEDAMFPERSDWGHASYQECCRLARRLRPKRFIISHHSPHLTDSVLLKREQEAKTLCAGAVFARAGMIIEL